MNLFRPRPSGMLLGTASQIMEGKQRKAKKKVEELHHAPTSSLVGNIIEKGFSLSSSSASSFSSVTFPPPTVLPFPVARHRSHGPHWAPVGTATAMDVDGEEDVEEDRDGTDYYPIAKFAKPVVKKERKGMDFSRWRQMLKEEEKKKVEVKKELNDKDRMKSLGSTEGGILKVVECRAEEQESKSLDKKKKKSTVLGDDELVSEKFDLRSRMDITVGEDNNVGNLDSCAKVDLAHTDGNSKIQALPVHEIEKTVDYVMDDIDVENRACLSEMSQAEIAKEQAEIKEKLNPAILEMLKKRGRGKLQGTKRSLGMSIKDNETKAAVGGGKTESVLHFSSGHDSGLWKSWSKRVEKARELRFSLDGNIVKKEYFDDQTKENSQYSVDNVAERDFLRTEGDPIAAGYTIQEAVALSRSVIPGQRVFALQLLSSVLSRALENVKNLDTQSNMRSMIDPSNLVDWQALWAYTLGPEPEIILSLRIALDDNHTSVVLACAKAIECILSYHSNESFFNISEKSLVHQKSLCTAPVFRSKPEVIHGFLHGGFWKYNIKPSHILPTLNNDDDDDVDGKNTIQDDVTISGQDVSAGLVRMGILPRICYLLETDCLPTLEEYLTSILIGLARHSPTCSSVIFRCPRLIQTIVNRITKLTTLENYPCQIKSVKLLRVLSEAGKENCVGFVNSGFFHMIMWQFYKPLLSFNDWIKSGKDKCMSMSSLTVELLGLWKVCIRYGYCVHYFADFFPALCLWLSPPDLDKLQENTLLSEFASVSLHAYNVLEALSQRLPNLHSSEQLDKQVKAIPNDGIETWSWSHAVPMVDLGMKWLNLKNIPFVFHVSDPLKCSHLDSSTCLILGVISAVMRMFSSILNRIAAVDASRTDNSCGPLPWLPDFVPKIGLAIVKSGFLNFLEPSGKGQELCAAKISLVAYLCHLRHHNDVEVSLTSASCLRGLVHLVISVDHCIQQAKGLRCDKYLKECYSSLEAKILEEGVAKWAQNDISRALGVFEDVFPPMWHGLQPIEMFGRGGPAPGVGIGWGSSGGGFWSTKLLLAQGDAQLFLSLLEIFPILNDTDLVTSSATRLTDVLQFESIFPNLKKINSVLGICLVAGPGDKPTLEKAFDLFLHDSTLKYLDTCIHLFLHLKEGFKPFDWHFTEEERFLLGKILNAHFKKRWLSPKKKLSKEVDRSNLDTSMKKDFPLDTIPEESDALDMSYEHHEDTLLSTEWSKQRLPIPIHWFLSPITTVSDLETANCILGSSKVENKNMSCTEDVFQVVRGGTFLLLGLEALCYLLSKKDVDTPVLGVPLVWKLHALSMALLVKIEILEEPKFRDVFETLQSIYGENLIQLKQKSIKPGSQETTAPSEILDFQMLVHESYNTFVEILVEHFASISYGDVIYGRQVVVYLHRSVGQSVRLAAWNALSNALVLELLPPLESCIGEARGYTEPLEDDEAMLEAYVKSWISGGLDKAATRGSMAFTLALHHLASFIFYCDVPDKLTLRNKLAKSLLRGFSRKQNDDGLMKKFVGYRRSTPQDHGVEIGSPEYSTETIRRLTVLSEACEGNSFLLTVVEKLKSLCSNCSPPA